MSTPIEDDRLYQSLRRALQANGLSIRELSYLADKNYATILTWFNGTKIPRDSESLFPVTRVLGLSDRVALRWLHKEANHPIVAATAAHGSGRSPGCPCYKCRNWAFKDEQFIETVRRWKANRRNFPGVRPNARKWVFTTTTEQGRAVYHGTYDTPEEAREARRRYLGPGNICDVCGRKLRKNSYGVIAVCSCSRNEDEYTARRRESQRICKANERRRIKEAHEARQKKLKELGG
jgi:hypothetical protein